uniref:Uncharacterized protein n=1 Tax=Denticeps clupeoides TaxID=299321 RepID=A0AAY4AKX6_9TELE
MMTTAGPLLSPIQMPLILLVYVFPTVAFSAYISVTAVLLSCWVTDYSTSC